MWEIGIFCLSKLDEWLAGESNVCFVVAVGASASCVGRQKGLCGRCQIRVTNMQDLCGRCQIRVTNNALHQIYTYVRGWRNVTLALLL